MERGVRVLMARMEMMENVQVEKGQNGQKGG